MVLGQSANRGGVYILKVPKLRITRFILLTALRRQYLDAWTRLAFVAYPNARLFRNESAQNPNRRPRMNVD
jgi:hypothetical protein